MKVYLIINKNAEGYNFLGVFDTREAAEEQVSNYNHKNEEELRKLYKDDPRALKTILPFSVDWEKAEVVEFEMNKTRFEFKE